MSQTVKSKPKTGPLIKFHVYDADGIQVHTDKGPATVTAYTVKSARHQARQAWGQGAQVHGQ